MTCRDQICGLSLALALTHFPTKEMPKNQWRTATVGTWIFPGSPSHRHHSSQATWHHGWAGRTGLTWDRRGGHECTTHTQHTAFKGRIGHVSFLLVETYYKHMDHSLPMIGRFQSYCSIQHCQDSAVRNALWRSPAAFPPWMSSPRGFPAFEGEGMGLHVNSSITSIWIQSESNPKSRECGLRLRARCSDVETMSTTDSTKIYQTNTDRLPEVDICSSRCLRCLLWFSSHGCVGSPFLAASGGQLIRYAMSFSISNPLPNEKTCKFYLFRQTLSLSAGSLSLSYCSSHWLHLELACDSGQLQTAWKRGSWVV